MLKRISRSLIIGITLLFVAITVKQHWQAVKSINLDRQGITFLILALVTTLLAHLWAALVWFSIIKSLRLTLTPRQTTKLYLTTNIAKYIPGNIGHFSARVWTLSQQGRSLRLATLATFLDPLLIAAAALIIALLSQGLGLMQTGHSYFSISLQIVGLIIVILGVHPLVLNHLIHWLGRLKKQPETDNSIYLTQYPLIPLFGSCGFVFLRGIGFILTWLAFAPLTPHQGMTLFGAFSFAWLLGLIVPGAPGGLGVFEASAIALLPASTFSVGILIPTLAFFRVISILAEAIAAGWAWQWRVDA
jgi:uncharacterized membrane protein YbhN (UPF0104 family)